MSETDAELVVRVEGRVGRLTLNRPRALNALTLGMCRAMLEALTAWRADPAVALVLIEGAGDRAFCAGGDVRAAAASGAGDAQGALEFFRTEYRLNELLFRYEKPTLAVMDGITMGGGIGLSQPCRFRLATERTLLAMPETAIGFFPDVGAAWHLARMPDAIGIWLALTGARVGPADGELLGLATDYVESRDVADLTAAIVQEPEATERLLTERDADPGRPEVAAHQDEIARIFSQQSVEQILAALERAGTAWAGEQLEVLRARSPQALKVAFRLLREAASTSSFADEMAREYRIAARLAKSPDFHEGVRAVLVDKDHAPRWRPDRLEAVSETQIDEIFAPLPAGEEWSPLA